MRYGLIGERLPHSFSKDIHRLIGEYIKEPYAYDLFELKEDEVGGFLRSDDLGAVNVTIPYKEKVIGLIDETDPTALKIGAVNTIVNRTGRLCGYNTDYFGLRDLIIGADIELKDTKVLILGTGGTSKTAAAVCRDLGARKIFKVSRKPAADMASDDFGTSEISYDTALTEHTDADVIINTTPVGMYPKTDVMPIDISLFSSLKGVVDVIYNPLKTRLVLEAQKAGIKCTGGLKMLVIQAVYAYFLFMGREFDTVLCSELTDRIFDRLYTSKLNIILTGMPGSGKSTVGRMLASITGRELTDTDDEIIKREGREITDIFSNEGESYFRDIESAVIRDVCSETGRIISTGGGAILKPENIDAMKSNGRVIFLDRPLEDLIPTDDRPTASDREMLSRRYKERYDIYRNTADRMINVDTDDIKALAERILSE